MNNLEQIKIDAVEKFGGNVRVAVAAHLYGEMIIFDCGNQVPAWAEQDKINELESQVNNLIAQDELQGEKLPVSIATNEAEKVEETEKAAEAEKEETETTEQTKFTEAELFEIVLSANKQNVTIGNAIVQKIYAEKGFDADGSFSGLVNVHKVAYVKGLITQLLNSQKVEEVEKVAEVEATEEKPTEATTDANKDELEAAEVEKTKNGE